jgi:hypothetical protein
LYSETADFPGVLMRLPWERDDLDDLAQQLRLESDARPEKWMELSRHLRALSFDKDGQGRMSRTAAQLSESLTVRKAAAVRQAKSSGHVADWTTPTFHIK